MTSFVPNAHLQAKRTGRGFQYLPPIPSEYGGEVSVSESSAARAPHIWLRAAAPANLNEPDGPMVEAPIHLTVENALRLAEQLRFIVKHHYQLWFCRDHVSAPLELVSNSFDSSCARCRDELENHEPEKP